jgi:hypothetical protein
MRKIQAARELHVKRILEEQKRQRTMHDYNEDAIARLSRKSSRKTREHSHKVAAAALSVVV